MACQLTTLGIADRIVKVRPGSPYHVVDRLADEKLIRRAGTSRDGKRPERAIYEITDAGAEALADKVGQLIAVPAHEFPQVAVALAEIDTLDADAAANAVDDRVGALEARIAEITALRDVSVTPAGYLVAFGYLLATMHAELSWLQGFAGSMRTDQPRPEGTNEVEI